MITDFDGKTAVLTGAGSGFGLECARIAANRGMNLVLVDVQADALAAAVAEVSAVLGPDSASKIMACNVDVSSEAAMDGLGAAVLAKFGAPHFVFNNAGVGSGGLIWENSARDWQWVLGVNVLGVAHGVRVFTLG